MGHGTELAGVAAPVDEAARHWHAELEWLAAWVAWRLRQYFAEETGGDDAAEPPNPPRGELPQHPQHEPASGLGALTDPVWAPGLMERLLMALAVAPILRPQLLDVLATVNPATGQVYTEFGGQWQQGVRPTVQTAAFLWAGDSLRERLAVLAAVSPEAALCRQGWLQLEPGPAERDATHPAPAASPALWQLPLQPGPRLWRHACPGVGLQGAAPGSGLAEPVSTGLRWEDLVLPPATLAQLEDIGLWLSHGRTLLQDWGFGRRVGPGHVSLFHGPPGTGKTLSASLLGQRFGRPVYRIDLSRVVSKYIGETEKNLGRLFDEAERGGWILFFDEADALFGKRTSVTDAHDRYANQEVSYLLQRIEAFAGVVVLATNLRHNIDEAFLRRFQSVVSFQLPKAPERLRLWREALPRAVRLDPSLDLARLAQQHELSGGTIVNVLRHACLRALGRGDGVLRADEVEEGIRRELLKEGRSL